MYPNSHQAHEKIISSAREIQIKTAVRECVISTRMTITKMTMTC